MALFSVVLVQLDLDNPESFQYQVFTNDPHEGVMVSAFSSLDEANAFIVENGGDPQTVRVWTKGIQATAGSTYR